MDDNVRLLALQQRLIKNLPNDSRALARLSRSCLVADRVDRERREIADYLHRLAGRCSQLGFDQLGQKLIMLERRLEKTQPNDAAGLAEIATRASDAIDETLIADTPKIAPLKPPGRYMKITASAGKTALVVEDDVELGPLARGALSDMGFDAVRLAHSGEQALSECYIMKPDLIVCDWRLRKASGLDLLKTIRNGGVAGLEATPFIMLTGQNDKKSVQTALREGADDFITKPFALHRLRIAVLRLLSPRAQDEDALAV